MHRKHYIKTVNVHFKQKTCISSFIFHLIYVSLYLTVKKSLFNSRQSNLTVMSSDAWVLQWFFCLKICKASPKILLSEQSISVFFDHSSQTECMRAREEWIILDYLCGAWEAYHKTATAEINLLYFPGNLQRLFYEEIETPFARSLPMKGILNHRKPGHKNSMRVPHRSR